MEESNAGRVVFVGGIFRDLVACAPRFPKAGETIFGTKFHTGFGGKAANAAVTCSRLGVPVSMIGKLGNDDNGKAYREAFAKNKVDTTYVFIDPEASSGVASILVDTETGQNEIVVVPGSNNTLTPQEVKKAEDMISKARLVTFGLEGSHDAVIEALSIAKKYNVPTLTNAAPASTSINAKIFELTDILCVNETEAQIITKREDAIETESEIQNAITDLLKLCKTVVITLGDKGAAVASRDEPEAKWIKADKVNNVVDTTGAGDCFVGSMAFFLASKPNLGLQEVVRRACQIASISVQAEGTQSSFPYRSDLPEILFQ